jgi:hypothetical protein
MILRIVLGRFAAGTEAATLVTLRDQLTRAARTVNGLESLILGVRAADELEAASAAAATEPAPGPDGAVVSVWRDVESMSRATGDVTTDRLISTRFQLPMRTTATHHFELVDRAFGALPPDAVALLRIVTIRARLNEEARLLEILRARQPRMIDRGLVGTQLARRVVAGGEVEAAVTALWPDRSSVIQAAVAVRSTMRSSPSMMKRGGPLGGGSRGAISMASKASMVSRSCQSRRSSGSGRAVSSGRPAAWMTLDRSGHSAVTAASTSPPAT